MNKTKIIRSPKDKDNPFTRISNLLINDNRLSDTEVGLMVRILSNADDWIISKEYQQRKSLLTRGSFNTAWKNVVRYGYIEQTKTYSPYISYTYKIIENPVPDSKYPTYQFPQVEIPQVENGALITTNIINESKPNLTGVSKITENEVEVRHPARTKLEKLDPDTGTGTGPVETIVSGPKLDELWNQENEKAK